MHHKTLLELCRDAVQRGRVTLYDAGRKVDLVPRQPPEPKASFGYISDWVTVDKPFKAAFVWLFFPFDPKRLGWIERGTLRVFRFDPAEKRLERIAFGRPHATEPVVCAAVDKPGIYGLIGLNQHPLVNEAIRRFCEARTTVRGLPEPMRPGFRDRTCELILCSPDMQKIAGSRDLLAEFAATRGQTVPDPLPPALPYTTSPNETVCDRCHGIDLDDFPDCDLLLEPVERPCRDARWESVGPDHISGAMRQVVIDPTNRRRLYAVAANGGIWRLDNIDEYPDKVWLPLTDTQRTLRFRTMAVAPSRGRILYAANSIKELTLPSQDVYSEIYRSPDRGLTWFSIEEPGMGVVHRLIVHPANPDVVFAATSTGLWRRNTHPGTWQSLFVDDCLDVALDPDDSSIVYLGVRTVGVFKSFTSGAIWTVDPVVMFDPAAAGNHREMIKIALGRRNADGSVQGSTSRTVAVRFGNELCVNNQSGEGGAAAWLRTVPVVMVPNPEPPPAAKDDVPRLLGGGNKLRSDTDPAKDNEWVNCLAVDPFDAQHVIMGSVSLMVRANAASPIIPLNSAHEDEHSIAFDPDTKGLVYLANDGGVFSSIDSGSHWAGMQLAHTQRDPSRGLNFAKGLVTSEFRHSVVRAGRAVAAIDHTGFVLTEDFSGRWQFLFSGADASGRHAHEGTYVFRCPASLDRYYIFNNRKEDDPLTTAHAPVIGRLAQLDFRRTGAFVDPPDFAFLSPLKAGLREEGNYFPDTAVYRNRLPGPFAARFSAANQQRLLLFGTEPVAPSQFTIQSLRLAKDGTDVILATREGTNSDPFAALLFVPNDPDRAFAISSMGELFERDFSAAGAFDSVASWDRGGIDALVSHLVAVSHPSLRLFALSHRAVGRFEDATATWTTVHVPADPDETLLSLAPHPSRDSTLFLGTNRGVYVSEDDGSNWRPYDLKLPNVPVTELSFDGGYLYAATYGRGLWRCRPC